jgi:group I intron endonuclease
MSSMDTIYKITSPSGKVYIGRTNDFDTRMSQHKHGAYTRKLKTSLYRAIRKYGWDNFTKEIICEVEADKARVLEEELIRAYNSVYKGYNDTYEGGGGDIWKDRKDTPEFAEFIDRMKTVTSGKNNPMYGKNHSDEAKAKQKAKAKGRYSLDWFKERNGDTEGERLYEERRKWLKSRNLPKGNGGRFVTKCRKCSPMVDGGYCQCVAEGILV